jgi:metallo-beta-lactamase class B
MRRNLLSLMCFALLGAPMSMPHAATPPDKPQPTMRERWAMPREPFRLIGNTWYVGTEGITVLLIRDDHGSILLDTGVAESASNVLANLKTVGLEPTDIKLILTSHAHHDHTGGIAEIKRATGARVLASAESAAMLGTGGANDLHFKDDISYPTLTVDGIVRDGETVTVGNLELTAHFTPAHTPGSTSWTWNEIDGGSTVRMVYADSITAPGYQLIGNQKYPHIVEDFRRGFAAIRALPCDVLITPHPEASGLFDRIAAVPSKLIDGQGCKAYADRAEKVFEGLVAEQEKLGN